MKKFLGILIFMSVALVTQAQTTDTTDTSALRKMVREILREERAEESGKMTWLPEVHGVICAKYEWQPDINRHRFEVRNARVSVTGKVHKSVLYKAEIDLSDEGTIKMLDAYVRLLPFKGLAFTIGQMRVPFTIDAHRSPHQRYFGNRSFIAKQVGNVRDVGMTVGYTFEQPMRVILEAGLFNGSGLTNQKVWHNDLNYTFKAQFFLTPTWNITASMQRIKPESVAIHMVDIGSYVKFGNLHIEGEYLRKMYKNDAFEAVTAVNTFANYDIMLRKVFHKVSILGRFDYMGNHSDGKADISTGLLKINDYARKRATGGVTLSIAKPFLADIRLNYEHYFYGKSAIKKESEQSKIVAEFMVRF